MNFPQAIDPPFISMVSIRDLYSTVMVEFEEDIQETRAIIYGDHAGT